MEWSMGEAGTQFEPAVINQLRQRLVRYEDWEIRLADYLYQCAGRRFKYGTFDCCKFSAGAVEVMTGVDVMAGFSYHDARAAKLEIPRGLLAAFSTVMEQAGVKQVSPSFAQRGDLVVGKFPRTTVGVVALDGKRAHFVTRKGH